MRSSDTNPTTTGLAANLPLPWGRSALVGGAIWFTWATAVRPEWTAVLLLLSPFVLLSLGLRLAASPSSGPTSPLLNRLANAAPVIAVAPAASFMFTPGWLPALVTIPWLSFTLAVAAAGCGRLLSRRSLNQPGIGTDAGLILVAVGGAWLTISRAGLNPLGFSDAIVQLTAVHFHYAGFALPIVAGFSAERLGRTALVPAAVIAGVPLTAVGITAGGWLEWFAATAMAVAGMATALLLVRLALQQRGPARALLLAAGGCLSCGMALALSWAWSMRFGWRFLGLESMAATHGSLNALGFGLLGLIGLNQTLKDDNHQTIPATQRNAAALAGVHFGRPTAGRLAQMAALVHGQETTNPPGLLDRPVPPGYTKRTWQRRPEHAELSAAAAAFAQWSGHRAVGIKLSPVQPSLAVGQTLALAIPVGPISVSATCRIIKVIDEQDRYGFVYSTLPHHPEDGEESFVVSRSGDGKIDVTVTAVWRPATVANHVFPPLTRLLQNRAINRYLDGIADAITTTESITTTKAAPTLEGETV